MKSSIKTVLILWMLLPVVRLAGQAPTTLTGRIMDAQGGALVGAQVTLYPRDGAAAPFRSTTDGTGVYRFERLRPGEYLIEAEAPGFWRSAVEEIIVDEGTSTQDIRLSVAGRHDEIVVTASGTPQSADEVSKAMTTIDWQEIDLRDELCI